MAPPAKALGAGLWIAIALVAAFSVSAVAGLWDDEPAQDGIPALGQGTERPADVRVEVLNGAGVGGLARDATHHLRDDGFDVVFYGNADRFDHARSVAIDRSGDLNRARLVAAALGIDSVVSAPDSSLMLEVTLVLGQDWPPEPVPEQSWSDRVRQLLGRDSLPSRDPATGAAAGARED